MRFVIEISPQVRIDHLVATTTIAADVLRRFGLHCAGFGISKYETHADEVTNLGAALADGGEIESVESPAIDAAADALLERLTPAAVS